MRADKTAHIFSRLSTRASFLTLRPVAAATAAVAAAAAAAVAAGGEQAGREHVRSVAAMLVNWRRASIRDCALRLPPIGVVDRLRVVRVVAAAVVVAIAA